MYFTMAPIFREKKFSVARGVLDNINTQIEQGEEHLYWSKGFRYSRPISINDFKETQQLYKYLSRQDYDSYMLRVQQTSINWYSNNYDKMQELISKFPDKVTSIAQPNPLHKDILKPNIIIKDYDFEFKVTVGAYVDANVAYWFENNPDKVRIGKIFLDSIKQGQYVKGFYFYAKNEKVLNLVKIILGGKITRVDKFVNNMQS